MMHLPFYVHCRRVRFGSLLAASWAIAALLAVHSAGANEIYKCRGTDGKIVFTSSRAACPNAQPHVLKARVQHVIEPKGPRSAARGPAPQ